MRCAAFLDFARASESNVYTKTFVSRKNLPLIHFVSGVWSGRLNVPQPLHKRLNRSTATDLRRILFQPLAERGVQSCAAGLCDQSSLLDQVFVGTERYVFHTNLVYTILVRLTT